MMGINCCEEDDPDEITLCELNSNDLAVVTITDELEYAEAIKKID